MVRIVSECFPIVKHLVTRLLSYYQIPLLIVLEAFIGYPSNRMLFSFRFH